MGELLLSEHMQLVQLFVQIEAARDTVDELGKLGIIEFKDVHQKKKKNPALPLPLFSFFFFFFSGPAHHRFQQLNPDVNAFQRNFVAEVTKFDEMERKIRFFNDQVELEKKEVERERGLKTPLELVRVSASAQRAKEKKKKRTEREQEQLEERTLTVSFLPFFCFSSGQVDQGSRSDAPVAPIDDLKVRTLQQRSGTHRVLSFVLILWFFFFSLFLSRLKNRLKWTTWRRKLFKSTRIKNSC
jgi:hypothetical protein